MHEPSPIACLIEITDAIDLIRSEMTGVTLEAFESDRSKRWLVERGIEIISEASRRLPADMRARHADILWPKVAAIGNVLRHEVPGRGARRAMARGAGQPAAHGGRLP
jgi:uncharacterized protein with HEPN domain